ncbi:integrase [Patescibacteria group bacterium AH-259-L07]|nr:integrase [Patescibacteria group bacterium AH-259-L07]
MNDSHIVSITQMREFVKGSQDITFKAISRKQTYQWIDTIVTRFRYVTLRKKDKTAIKDYLMKMTGYSDAQITRLIARKKKCGRIVADSTGRHKFPRKYTAKDIALLIETDTVHDCIAGPATKKIVEREYMVYGKKAYHRLKNISVSHIYNLRKTRQYRSQTMIFKKTKAVKAPDIGVQQKPQTYGKPGYLRVDTVHQGDCGKKKGVYHINMVDEVTQWEVMGAVETISERYLEPLLRALIKQYPFIIFGFHSDNGSEYINRIVANLLNKLLIKQTKSRTRHCNDNALVEGRNGSRVRKHMAHAYIPQVAAPQINRFYQTYFNVYLNYHRPCGYATTITDKRGKQTKIYPYSQYQTPYERFKSLKYADKYLKRGMTFAKLDVIASTHSDNEFAKIMQKAKAELFLNFNHKLQLPTSYAIPISGSYDD